MSFSHDTNSTRVHTDQGRPGRPSFSSHVTSDRLREGERTFSSSIPISKTKPQRRSIFKEEGLDDVSSVNRSHDINNSKPPSIEAADRKEAKVTLDNILKDLEQKDTEVAKKSLLSRFKGSRPTIRTTASAPPGMFPTIPRAALIVLLICVVVPGFRYSGGGENISGADAGVIRTPELVENGSMIEGRQNSPTAICMRWAHQSTFFDFRLIDSGER
jgi:hypothetical protein